MARAVLCTVLVNYDRGQVKLLKRKPASVSRGWEIPEGMMGISREQAEEYLRAWSHLLKPVEANQIVAI